MNPPAPANDAILLFSGGQDSTTCLFWARRHFANVRLLIIDYGQRHRVEVDQAVHIAQDLGHPWRVVDFAPFQQFRANALTHHATTPLATTPANALPATFVPGRNLIFLNLAALWAYDTQTHDLITGVCQTDYSGYPDCRLPFIEATAQTLSLALDTPMRIHTPLMHLTKAQTWALADELGALDYIIEHSHTCYAGNRTLRHAWGYGCGHCDACRLRSTGYEAYHATRLTAPHEG
jgi:7-cyano-7-deazaguanine synthase